ncbi:hypothetical protein DR88_5231 [Klebsiella pneumoniae]|nr:hypothetical protein DR88_5231 [Klebsiella pneumoniae]
MIAFKRYAGSYGSTAMMSRNLPALPSHHKRKNV